jgi:hypothetical protein
LFCIIKPVGFVSGGFFVWWSLGELVLFVIGKNRPQGGSIDIKGAREGL